MFSVTEKQKWSQEIHHLARQLHQKVYGPAMGRLIQGTARELAEVLCRISRKGKRPGTNFLQDG